VTVISPLPSTLRQAQRPSGNGNCPCAEPVEAHTYAMATDIVFIYALEDVCPIKYLEKKW
jgi:hypothetical protein